MKKAFLVCAALLTLAAMAACKSRQSATICGTPYTTVSDIRTPFDERVQFQHLFAGTFYEGMMVMMENDKFGFYDSTGSVAIKPIYDGVRRFSEGLCAVWIGNKCGFIDKGGRLIIEPQYVDAGDFSEGLVAVMQDDKWGYVDKTGRVVIPIKYDIAKPFKNGKAQVSFIYGCEEETWIVDKDGNEYEDF